MSGFTRDMIHMTEGEKLVNYWWLWLLLVVIFALMMYCIKKHDDAKRCREHVQKLMQERDILEKELDEWEAEYKDVDRMKRMEGETS